MSNVGHAIRSIASASFEDGASTTAYPDESLTRRSIGAGDIATLLAATAVLDAKVAIASNPYVTLLHC